MQIRYQFIGDLDTIVIDKTSATPNLRLSALYGTSLFSNLPDVSVCFSRVVGNLRHCFCVSILLVL